MKKIAVFIAIVLCYGLLGPLVGFSIFNIVTLLKFFPTFTVDQRILMLIYACGLSPAIASGIFLALRAVYKTTAPLFAYYSLAFWFGIFNPLLFLYCLLLSPGILLVAEFLTLVDPFVAIATALVFYFALKISLKNTSYSLSTS